MFIQQSSQKHRQTQGGTTRKTKGQTDDRCIRNDLSKVTSGRRYDFLQTVRKRPVINDTHFLRQIKSF